MAAKGWLWVRRIVHGEARFDTSVIDADRGTALQVDIPGETTHAYVIAPAPDDPNHDRTRAEPMTDKPILWNFRRCPYAMRARSAILSAGITVELREILLRDKPPAFLQTSASATVPTLQLGDQVLDESLDIMIWALKQNDPDGLLDMPDDGFDLIATNDGPFKTALDHTKYASRHADLDPAVEREKASAFLVELDQRLARGALMGGRVTLADHAIWPFVRQFANTDKPWFDEQPWPALAAWLKRFTGTPRFAEIMTKYPLWAEGDAPVDFPR